MGADRPCVDAMNILMKISFMGTNYHGFQVQKNALSVCEAFQDAMEKVFGSRASVKGCSRTDSGVHAEEYCLSFHIDTMIPEHKIPLALNHYLPHDIRAKSAAVVPDDFHARYSALGKEYRYVIHNSFVSDAFYSHLCHRVGGKLDINVMQNAAEYLVGKHDFASFMSAGSNIQDTVRTISCLSFKQRGEFLDMHIAADGFLYNMVRIIAGTLLEVGLGRKPETWVKEVLLAKNRDMAGPTLPAQGLFLHKVFYPSDI